MGYSILDHIIYFKEESMKKVLALLLSAAMVLSMAGCGGGKDARTIYDEASKKTSELKDMDLTTNVAMTMSQGDQTIDVTTAMDIQMTGANTEDMRYLATGKTSMAGQDIDMSMYYEGGYYYMETMGQKIKYAMDLNQLMEQVKQSTEGANMESSYMKEITAKKDGENQRLTFTADAEKMDAYVQDIMSSMGTAAAGMEGVTYKIKEASGEAVVNKDGYFSSMKIKMLMDMEVQGETISIDMDTDAVYRNPGQEVTLAAPSLDGYQEVDPAAMGVQQ
ncbi:hypothetical protein CLOSTHATH_01271 [Hungatella hathewayi DSM 13479]|uniref:Uncharacterized protein n=2 Tax=Hungatella hathewayi TaxID=154046 RepID=D3ACE3_9FIRM|nr:hypothetical protein CLOSTHATH_01271 [Hungatella hathewayi DSM 13479]